VPPWRSWRVFRYCRSTTLFLCRKQAICRFCRNNSNFGSGLIGYFSFGERLSALQIAGYAIAVLGVMIAGLAAA